MLQLMILKEMALDEISFENETFRISEDLDFPPVRDSLRRVGQLSPVILLDQKPQMTIVCGFRRVFALKQLEKTHVFARIISVREWDFARAFELALWDNLSHRPLNPLEKARTLSKLREMCGIQDENLVAAYLPVLGLSSNPNVLNSYILLNGLPSDLRKCLLEGRLSIQSLEFLAAQPMQVQESMAALMNRIRLSASFQKKVLNLLDDLSSVTGVPFDAQLRAPGILEILGDVTLSPFQKGEKIYEYLYRLANPRLSHALYQFQSRKKLLNLPGTIQIRPHPFFEEPGVHVEFDALTVERFRQLAAALQTAAQSSDLEVLFQLD